MFYREMLFMGRMFGPGVAIAWVVGQEGPWGSNGQARLNPYRVDEGESTWSLNPDTREVARAYAEGRLPLWNSHIGFGAPFAAMAMPGAFDILRLPPLLSSKPVAWDIYYIGGSILGLMLTYLFARKIEMGLHASVLLPVAYVFSGFLFIRGNNYYMELYYLLPGLLWGIEIVLGGRLRAGVVIVAAMITLSVLAGYPEGALLTFSYAAAYAVYRLLGQLLDKVSWRLVLARTGLLGLAALIGLATSAPQTIPLMEFIANSFQRHTPENQFGLGHMPLEALSFLGVPSYKALPLQGGGYEDYTGAALLALASVGAAALFWPTGRRRLALFALGATLIIGGKVYGVPVINDLGRLPLFNVTFIQIFAQPLLVFSLGLLAAHAVQLTATGKLPRRSFLCGMVLFASYLAASIGLNWDNIRQLELAKVITDFASAAAVGCLAIGVAAALIRSRPGVAALGACGVVVAELLVLAPRGVYDERIDIFAKPPFVGFLQHQQQQRPFRIFSSQWVLYPNFSEAFALDDIRSLEAVFPFRYWTFVSELIQPLFDRFTGIIEVPGQPAVEVKHNKWLNLANVEYVLFQHNSSPYSTSEDLIRKFASESEGPIAANAGMMQIDGITRLILFEHPPSSITHQVQVDDDHGILKFWLAMDPNVWDPSKGDGVLFTVEVVDEDGVHTVFQRSIDPKNNPDDRHWIYGQADLSPFVGSSVQIHLNTGFMDNADFDWAVWGDVHFEPPPGAAQFVPAYAGEVDVYLNRQVLPRAFLVNSVTAAADLDAALQTMKAPDFDPSRSAVVEGAPASELARIEGPATTAAHVQVDRYSEQDVSISVSTEAPAVLVLTDAYFPGWEATLDGRPVAIYLTDLAFRGVIVPDGTHVIAFTYKPGSFTLAFAVAIIGLGVLLVVVYLLGTRRKTARLSS